MVDSLAHEIEERKRDVQAVREELAADAKVGPGRKCSKCQTMGINSRIDGLECVEGHFEHFLAKPYGKADNEALRAELVQHADAAVAQESAARHASVEVGRVSP